MASLKEFNITTDEFGFYKLTYKSRVMGRFATYRQATSHKLNLIHDMTKEGRCKSKKNRGQELTPYTELLLKYHELKQQLGDK